MAATRVLRQVGLLIGCCLVSQSGLAFSGFGQDVDGYIREASQRYQVSESMLRGLVKIEDGWYGNRSPTGALGVGQFTYKTWNWLASTEEGRRIGMQYITQRTRGTHADPRRHKRTNTLATALLARWHIGQFQERGIRLSDENLYLAHNIGLDGLHRAIQGRSTREDIKNMQRNGMKRGMSVRGFLNYQAGRYNQSKAIANHQSSTEVLVQQRNVKHNTSSPATTMNNLTTAARTNVRMPASVRWVEPLDGPEIRWVTPAH